MGINQSSTFTALKNMEGPICDLEVMGLFLAKLIDAIEGGKSPEGHPMLHFANAAEMNALAFAIYDIERRTKALQQEFQAAFTLDREVNHA